MKSFFETLTDNERGQIHSYQPNTKDPFTKLSKRVDRLIAIGEQPAVKAIAGFELSLSRDDYGTIETDLIVRLGGTVLDMRRFEATFSGNSYKVHVNEYPVIPEFRDYNNSDCDGASVSRKLRMERNEDSKVVHQVTGSVRPYYKLDDETYYGDFMIEQSLNNRELVRLAQLALNYTTFAVNLSEATQRLG